MDGRLAGARAEDLAGNADKISEVQQLLEQAVVQCLILPGGDVVAAHVDLHAPGTVLDAGEGSLAHHAAGHQAPGHRHLPEIRRFIVLVELGRFVDVLGQVRNGEGGGGEGLDAEIANLLEVFAADDFLIGEFRGHGSGLFCGQR